jgi:hypothetical protein
MTNEFARNPQVINFHCLLVLLKLKTDILDPKKAEGADF